MRITNNEEILAADFFPRVSALDSPPMEDSVSAQQDKGKTTDSDRR